MGCDDAPEEVDGGRDAGARVDAGEEEDGGVLVDAQVPDAFVPDGGPGDAGPGDAGPGDGGGVPCVPPVATAEDGNHRPGQDCLSCHNGAGAAPLFTVAGTIYTNAAGAAPVVGATITVVDADDRTVEMVSALNGNFWSTDPVTLPLQPVTASRCPDTEVMVSPATSASCNTCHNAAFRVHLP